MAARSFSGAKAGASPGQTPKTKPDTLRSKDTTELVLGISEGPIKGIVGGPTGFRVGDTKLGNADGTSNFDGFTLNEFHGQPGETITFTLGGQGSPKAVTQTLALNVPVIRTGDAQHLTHLDVRLVLQQMYENQQDGDVAETSVTFEIFHKPTTGSVWTSSFGGPLTIKGKETGAGYAKEFRFPVADIAGTYDLQIQRYSPPADQTFRHVVLVWDSFTQIVAGKWTWPGLAYTQLVAAANDQFTSIPQFWAEYDLRLLKVPTTLTQTDPSARTYAGTVWDGTFKLQWTDDPAWVIKDLVENTDYGLAKYAPGLTLDPADGLAAAKWWATPVSDGAGGTHPRFAMNLLLDEGKNGPEALAYVAGAVGGVCFEGDAGVVQLKVDRPTSAVHQFTSENIVGGDFEYSWSDWQTRYNDVTVSFLNKFLDYVEDRRRIFDAAHIAKFGPIPTTVVGVGCTHPQEAIRRARHRVVTATTETQSVTFKTNRLAHAVFPYDVILVGDPALGYGVTGRFLGLVAGFTNRFTLRDPVALAVGPSYQVKVQVPDTTNGNYQVVTLALASTTPRGSVKELWLAGAAPAGLPEFAVFELEQVGASFGIAKPFRVQRVNEVEGSPDLHEIVALETNLAKWSYVDDGTTIVVTNYGFPPGPPATPAGLVAAIGTRTSAGTQFTDLQLSWSRSATVSVDRYEVTYRRNGGPFTLLTSTPDTYADLLAPLPGIYEFAVVAITLSQQRSAPAKATLGVADATRVPNPPANLRVTGVGGTAFAGPDLQIDWDQPIPETMFRDYLVQILDAATNAVLRAQRVTAPNLDYTFDMNKADHGGVAVRSVKVQVQTEDLGLNLSVPVQQGFTNPAPAAPANATALATVEAVAVKLDPVVDPDLVAYQVYGSVTSGFTPGAPTLVYQGLNNTPLVKVAVGTTMYFRACALDAFGAGPFTAEFSATSTAALIQNASVVSAMLANGAVTGPKIAPAAVTTAALAVGDFTNLLTNGDFSSAFDGWSSLPAGAAVATAGLPTPPSGWTVPRALQVVNPSALAPVCASWQVKAGSEYVVSALAAGPSGSATVAVAWTMGDGSTQTATGTGTATGTVLAGAFTSLFGVFAAPSGAARGSLKVAFSGPPAAGAYWLALGSAIRRTDAILLQDGVVTAPKIATGAVQADAIAAGAVTADKIVAGSITTDKLSVGDYENQVPDPQFTAGGSWLLPAGWAVRGKNDAGVPPGASTSTVLAVPASTVEVDPHGLIQGSVWPTRSLTFCFPDQTYAGWGDTTAPVDGITVPLSTDWYPSTAAAKAGWRAAIAQMASRSGLTITELPASQAGSANIHIGVSRTLAQYNFNGYSSYPPKGWVFLPPAYDNVSYAPGTYIFQVCMHELGHLVGLQHPAVGTPLFDYAVTIMIPNSTQVSPWATTYRDADFAAVRFAYGLPAEAGITFDKVAPSSSGLVPCAPGETFYASAEVATGLDGTWEQGVLELRARFRTGAGVVDHAYPMPAGAAWDDWQAVFQAPADSVGVLFSLARVTDPSTATVYVTNVQLRRQVDHKGIAKGSITAEHVAAGTVFAAVIEAGSITTDKLAAKAITADKIGDQEVTSAALADAAITFAKIGEAEIGTIHLKGGSISVSNYHYNASAGPTSVAAGSTVDTSSSPVVVNPDPTSDVHINVTAYVQSSDSGGGTCAPVMRIMRGGVVAIEHKLTQKASPALGTFTVTVTETRADDLLSTVGPYNYYVAVLDNGGTRTLQMQDISILATELKR